MKRKGWPLWLLRDVPAFLGVLFSFWPLVIFVIRSERRAVREGKLRHSFLPAFASLLAHAEARIAFALWRQAYRQLGWNPRLVKFTLDPSTDDWDEAMARHRNYSATLNDLDAALAVYVETLRQQYRISERDACAGSFPLRLASRSTSPGYAGGGKARVACLGRFATGGGLSRRSAAKAEGGSRSPRGPPSAHQNCRSRHLSAPASEIAPARPLPSRTAPNPGNATVSSLTGRITCVV